MFSSAANEGCKTEKKVTKRKKGITSQPSDSEKPSKRAKKSSNSKHPAPDKNSSASRQTPHKQAKGGVKEPVKPLDIFLALPEPDPEIRITEVNLARAPVTKKDHDYRPVMFAGCMDLEAKRQIDKSLEGTIPERLIAQPDQIAAHVIVPAKSRWFDRKSIHDIEKRSLPEFFDGRNKAKSAEVYKAYRDYMIDRYRASPQQYLSNVECRRQLPGDLCSVFRVHAFLELWGLINYGLSIRNQLKPSRLLLPHTDAHYFTLAETSSGLHPAEPIRPSHKSVSDCILDLSYQHESDSVKPDPVNVQNHRSQATSSSLTTSAVTEKVDDDVVDGDDDDEGTAAPAATDVGDDQRTADLINSLGIKPKDIDLDKSQAIMLETSRKWTRLEVLRLLEGVEKYKDDWNKIGEHVGSRNQDECLLYFMRLPILEKFMNTSDDSPMAALDDDVLPFARSSNPISYTMSFLASVVEPRVAACAAKAALEVFSHLTEEAESAEPDDIVAKNIRDIKAAMNQSSSAGPTQSDPQTSDDKIKDFRLLPFNDKRIVKVALDLALEAAARKAEDLADGEKLRVKALVALIIDTQMKKLEIKLDHLDSLNNTLQAKHRQLESERLKLLSQREAYHQSVLEGFGLQARQTVLPSDLNALSSADQPQLLSSAHDADVGQLTKIKSDSPKFCMPSSARTWAKAEDPFGFGDSKPKQTDDVKPDLVTACTSSEFIAPEATVTASIPTTVKAEEDEESTTPDMTTDVSSPQQLQYLPSLLEDRDLVGERHRQEEEAEPYYLQTNSSDLRGTQIDMSSEDNQAAAFLDFS